MAVGVRVYSLTTVFAIAVCLSGVDVYLTRAGKIVGGSLLGIALLSMAFIFYVCQRKGRIYGADLRGRISPVLAVFTLFFLWILCSALYGPDLLESIFAFMRYFLFFSSAIVIAIIANDPAQRKLVSAGVVFALLLVCSTVWWDVLIPRTFAEGSRPGGIMINPNGAAQSATALLLIAGLVIESNKKFYFLGALVIMSVLVTLSRSGIVLSSLALFACFYYRSHYERFLTMKNTAIVAVAFFLAAVGGAYYLASTENVTILSRIEYLVSGQGFFDVEDPRIQLAKKYIDLWLQKPLLGFGTAATYSGDFNIVGATHNLYIKILVENGLLGLIMFLVALITCLFVSSNPIRFGVYIGWLVVIGWGFFANSLLDNRLFYTLVLVLVFSQSFMKSASEAARNKKILDL